MIPVKLLMRAVLFVVLLAGIPGVLIHAQDDSPQAVQDALSDLSERLGEAVTLETLDAYSWTETEFGDASLGCPQEGEMYAQVITPGFAVVLSYDGTTYDYRVASDGSQTIMCSSYPTQEGPGTPGDLVAAGSPITAETVQQVVELAQINTGDGATGVAAWSPGGDAIAAAAAGDAGGVLIYAPTAPDAAPQEVATGQPVTALAFGSSGGVTFLATGGAAGEVQFFQVVPPGTDAIVMATDVEQTINDIAVSPDLLIVASATGSAEMGDESTNAVHLWNTRTGRLITPIDNDVPVASVAFSPVADEQGRWLLAIGYETGAVDLYALQVAATEERVDVEWDHLTTLTGHGDAVRDLAFRPGGALLASASADGTVRLWNIDPAVDAPGAAVATLETAHGSVSSVAFNADGSLLATAGGDPDAVEASATTITLWNVAEPEAATAAAELESAGPVGSVAFSPDGLFLLSATEDGLLSLWGIPAGTGESLTANGAVG